MSRKYAGLDVHQSTTTIAVCNADGAFEIEEMQIKTEGEPMLMALRAFGDELSVAFEESTLARWLYELLDGEFTDVVVCHPSDLPDERGSKTDASDARRLARYLRMGELTPVYHGSEVDTALDEYVRAYDKIVDNLVRAKNRLKALYHKRNIDCQGDAIYDDQNRQQWLEKLDRPSFRHSASCYFAQIDLAASQRDELEGRMLQEARQASGWESVRSLPGFGDIRTARLLGIIGTPWRFRTKRQLWRYSGLAVEIHDSSQYTVEGPDGIEHRREVQTRGLNNGHPELKDIFKGAAETARTHYPEVREDYRARCQNKAPRLAKLDIARKLASQALTVWKRKEVYDPEKARWMTVSSAD